MFSSRAIAEGDLSGIAHSSNLLRVNAWLPALIDAIRLGLGDPLKLAFFPDRGLELGK